MTLPAWLLLLVYMLAVARVTGLIVTDTLTEAPRDAVLAWLDDRPATLGSYIAKLITCPWCASVWVAIVAVPLVWLWGTSPVMLVPALILAFSQAVGMISNLGR